MAWSKNGTPDTLTSTEDTLTISDLTSTIFNVDMNHNIASGNIQHRIRLGNGTIDTGSNYAYRTSQNGASDITASSQSLISANASLADIFAIHYITNISSEEKLLIGWTSEQQTAGAGTAPSRMEIVGKWTNTSNQYDQVQINNGNTGDYATDSNLSALGSDGTEELNVQDGAIYHDTDTNKEYVLYNNIWTEV